MNSPRSFFNHTLKIPGLLSSSQICVSETPAGFLVYLGSCGIKTNHSACLRHEFSCSWKLIILIKSSVPSYQLCFDFVLLIYIVRLWCSPESWILHYFHSWFPTPHDMDFSNRSLSVHFFPIKIVLIVSFWEPIILDLAFYPSMGWWFLILYSKQWTPLG